jgi:type II secretory pathway component PulJ
MNRRGFTVLELLIMIGLMAFMGAVSQRLFVSSIRTMQAARSTDTAIVRFDHAMMRLRADVWASSEISADSTSATLKQSDGQTITWRIDETGGLTRSEGDSTLAWQDVSRTAKFSADGPALVLHLSDGFNKSPGSIKLISQLQLSNGGAP